MSSYTTRIVDLPDEVICYIGLYLSLDDVTNYFLIQKDFESICKNHLFFEQRLRCIHGINIKKEEDAREIYSQMIKKRKKIEIKPFTREFVGGHGYGGWSFVFTEKDKENTIFRIDDKGEKKEFQMVDDPPEGKEYITIVVLPMLQNFRNRGRRKYTEERNNRKRIARFKFRISNTHIPYDLGDVEIGFVEHNIYSCKNSVDFGKFFKLETLGIDIIEDIVKNKKKLGFEMDVVDVRERPTSKCDLVMYHCGEEEDEKKKNGEVKIIQNMWKKKKKRINALHQKVYLSAKFSSVGQKLEVFEIDFEDIGIDEKVYEE